MKRFYRLIKKIKNRKWETINTDYSNSLGVTVYHQQDKFLFGYFDRAILMEGIFSSITFCGKLPNASEMDLPRAEELYEFIDSFFSSRAKGMKGLNPELFCKRYLQMHQQEITLKIDPNCASKAIMEFIEENTVWRVLMVIVPRTGEIHLSFTDLEEKGIYMPLYGYIDSLYIRTKEYNPFSQDSITSLTKRSFSGKVSCANNSRNYDFLFGSLIKNETPERVTALSHQRHHLLLDDLLRLMQNVYGSDMNGHSSLLQELFFTEPTIHERNHTSLYWVLPDADIQIQSGFRKAGSPEDGHNGLAFVKIDVVPRLFKQGKGQDWVFNRLSERRLVDIHI